MCLQNSDPPVQIWPVPPKKKGHPQGCPFSLEIKRPDLNNVNATRMSVARAGLTARNLNFCRRKKCKQIWPVVETLFGGVVGGEFKHFYGHAACVLP